MRYVNFRPAEESRFERWGRWILPWLLSAFICLILFLATVQAGVWG